MGQAGELTKIISTRCDWNSSLLAAGAYILNLAQINTIAPATAQAEFLRCCGSTRWAVAMTAGRPFHTPAQLLAEAEEIWRRLAPEDWREAFAHHPKIGDLDNLRQKFAGTWQWSTGEQQGVPDAEEQVLQALAAGNTAYEEKFGYIFIVCATGKNAAEMLAILQLRLPNAPETEITIAAQEQKKITRIRLHKLLELDPPSAAFLLDLDTKATAP